MIEEKEELQGQLIASGQIIGSIVGCKGEKGEKGDPGEPGSPGSPGTPGQDGFSPIASISKTGKIATITITDSQGTTTAEIRDGEDGSGSGDMLKATYDTNDNGIVDNAEKVNNHTVQSDVPANAVFTDTTYTAGTGIEITANNVINNTQTSAEWGNISGDIDDQTDLQNILADKVDSNDLAAVATSGSYNDLSDKPSIMSGLTELSYGSSTWNDFITAYNNNQIVYCRASSGSNPGSGSQTRKAFMAYVNNPTSPTSVEFQYVRSIQSHSDSQQGDQVFVYTLTSANGGTWSVSTREMSTKVVAGTNMTSSYSSGVLTLNAEAESIPVQDTAPSNPSEDDLWIDTSEESGGENILDVIFPVGSIVIKADNQDYSSWLGFTWERTLVGRVAVGIDSTQTEFDTIGETGGEKTHQLTVNEMPSHNHNLNKSMVAAMTTLDGVNDIQQIGGQRIYEYITINNTGGDQPHNNLQPYQVVAYWKRTA